MRSAHSGASDAGLQLELEPQVDPAQRDADQPGDPAGRAVGADHDPRPQVAGVGRDQDRLGLLGHLQHRTRSAQVGAGGGRHPCQPVVELAAGRRLDQRAVDRAGERSATPERERRAADVGPAGRRAPAGGPGPARSALPRRSCSAGTQPGRAGRPGPRWPQPRERRTTRRARRRRPPRRSPPRPPRRRPYVSAHAHRPTLSEHRDRRTARAGLGGHARHGCVRRVEPVHRTRGDRQPGRGRQPDRPARALGQRADDAVARADQRHRAAQLGRGRDHGVPVLRLRGLAGEGRPGPRRPPPAADPEAGRADVVRHRRGVLRPAGPLGRAGPGCRRLPPARRGPQGAR